MALALASGASLVRAAQKDERLVERLTASASEVLRLFGDRTWRRRSHLLAAASEILYGSLTTLRGLQTLGEEYAAIVQVDDSTYARLPSRLCRLLAIVAGACGEATARRALAALRRRVERDARLLPEARRALLRAIVLARWALPLLRDLHRALFYLGAGRHYSAAKRLAGVDYVEAVPGCGRAGPADAALRPLGATRLARACLEAAAAPPSLDVDVEPPSRDGGGAASSADGAGGRCVGCLETNATPCALPCGHVLCNACARASHSCALCRSPYHPNRTVPLQNVSFVLSART